MSRIKRKQIDLAITLPTDGAYGGTNSPNVLQGDMLEDALDKIITVLDSLAPQKPPTLSQVVYGLASGAFSTGKIAGVGGADVSTIIPGGASTPYNAAPIFRSTALINNTGIFTTAPVPHLFQDGRTGYVYLAGETAPTSVLDIAASETSTTTASSKVLTVLQDVDYWNGVAGRAGFWDALNVSVGWPATPASTANHAFSISHSATDPAGTAQNTGTATANFYVEEPTAPNVASVYLHSTTHTRNSSRIVSGVPSFDTTDIINLRADLQRVVKFFYKQNPLTITSNIVDAPVWAWNGSVPAIGGTAAGSPTTVAVLPSVPKANTFMNSGASYSVKADDVLGNNDTTAINSGDRDKLRIDTVSDLTRDSNVRFLTGASSFDRSFATAYAHATDLVTGNYANELQLEGGEYKYPTQLNYSTFLLGGPDYSGITSAGAMRYATWRVANNVNNIKSIAFNLPGITQLLTDANFGVWVMVTGSTGTPLTGWLDAGKAYNDTPQDRTDIANVSMNGAAAMSTSLSPGISTAAVRYAFVAPGGSGGIAPTGTNGHIYVRIGWNGSKRSTLKLTARPTLTANATGGVGTYTAL